LALFDDSRGGQRTTALPGYFRRQFSRSRWHRQSQYRDSGRCSQFWCGRAGAEPHANFRFGGKLALPWFGEGNVYRTSADRDRCWRSTRRPASHTVASSAHARSRNAQRKGSRQLSCLSDADNDQGPYGSPVEIRAAYMPDAAWAVSGILQAYPGGRVSPQFRHRLIGFRHFCSGSLALASLNLACRDHIPTFPQRSPPWILATAACGGLRSTPDCRTRRAVLHLSYSYAAPCGPALLVTQDPISTFRHR
jgi:hypothetical protein